MSTARLSLKEIDLFAVANGPGSFTGIRVGVAAAQGLATAFGRPVKAVSSLEAMVEEAQPESSRAVSILDARRGEFFLANFQRVFENSKSRFAQQGESVVVKAEALLAFLKGLAHQTPPESPIDHVIRENDQSALALRRQAGDSLSWRIVPGILVGAVARLAFRAAGMGDLQSPGEVDACYVRRSDAELKLTGSHGQDPT